MSIYICPVYSWNFSGPVFAQSCVCNEPTSRQNSTTDTFSNNGQKGNTICLQIDLIAKPQQHWNNWLLNCHHTKRTFTEVYCRCKSMKRNKYKWSLWLRKNVTLGARGGRYPIWFNSMFEFCQKKWFIQYSIQFCLTQDSIQKNSADSIQKIIQFNSQGIINTGRMGKLPKKCPK